MVDGSGGSVINVEITDEPVSVGRPYQDKSTGMMRPAISKQNAYLHSGKSYPVPFKVIVPDSGPYRPGRYLLAGDVFKPGEYDGLKFFDRTLQLIPLEVALRSLVSSVPPGPKLAVSA